jgi:uncharacterized protein
MIVKRTLYLKKLISLLSSKDIKVVAGIRRCGKSTLLRDEFMPYLKENGYSEETIIYIPLDSQKYSYLREVGAFQDYVNAKLPRDGGPCVLIFDEIQKLGELVKKADGTIVEVKHPDPKVFVGTLNEYNALPNTNIYVSGSNSRFLSSDIITEFRGRSFTVMVHPLSFKEYLSSGTFKEEAAWQDYQIYGGMPILLGASDKATKKEMLADLFQNSYINDIIDRNELSSSLMDPFADVLCSNVANQTNSENIARRIKAYRRKEIDGETVQKYIDLFVHAFLFSKCLRYDVRGGEYFKSNYKLYCEDQGLRNARLNFREPDFGRNLENIIFNELIIAGYKPDVGTLTTFERDKDGKKSRKNLEIDFVANRGDEKIYVQVCKEPLLSLSRLNNELSSLSLSEIKDSFPKYYVVDGLQEPITLSNGVKVVDARPFILSLHD